MNKEILLQDLVLTMEWFVLWTSLLGPGQLAVVQRQVVHGHAPVEGMVVVFREHNLIKLG